MCLWYVQCIYAQNLHLSCNSTNLRNWLQQSIHLAKHRTSQAYKTHTPDLSHKVCNIHAAYHFLAEGVGVRLVVASGHSVTTASSHVGPQDCPWFVDADEAFLTASGLLQHLILHNVCLASQAQTRHTDKSG